MSPGTIVNLVARCADHYQGFASTLRRAVAQVPMKYMDETGIRIEGNLHWLHGVGTTLLTFFWIGTDRGDGVKGRGSSVS